MEQILKSIVSGVITFAAAGGIWMWGHSVGISKNDALVELLKEEKSSLTVENTKILQQNDSLKFQLLSVSKVPDEKAPQEQSILVSTSKEQIKKADTESPNASVENSKHEEHTINSEETKTYFGGDIEITLIGTDYTGDPLRHQVFANIFAPPEEPLKVENADPGSVFNIANYQILITKAGTFTASFKVLKKEI